MIDLHCHILPGIDDGSDTVEDSLEMARKAVSQGITHILCTPHHQNGIYINPKYKVIERVADLQRIFDQENIPIQLFEGQEIRLYENLIRDIRRDEILFCDMLDRYLLIEFPTNRIPDEAHIVLQELIDIGKHPIIVHPERNGGFIEDPNLLIPFLQMGCLAQLTAPSILGMFGKKIQRTAKLMVKHNLVQTIASDAHGVHKRDFFLEEAYDFVASYYGEEKSEFFHRITKSIFNGESVEAFPYSEISKIEQLFR